MVVESIWKNGEKKPFLVQRRPFSFYILILNMEAFA